jgi:hypothetical protein
MTGRLKISSAVIPFSVFTQARSKPVDPLRTFMSLFADSRRTDGARKIDMVRFDQPIGSMTLGDMRELGVRSLFVSCWQCHHEAVLNADRWPDHVTVPSFGPRMVRTSCRIVGADARPNWKERPERESLTRVQWRT